MHKKYKKGEKNMKRPQKIHFKNAIKYNQDICYHASNLYYITLSRMTYVNTEDLVSPTETIDLSKLINIDKSIIKVKNWRNYNIYVHPDLEKLAKAFGYDIMSKDIWYINPDFQIEEYKQKFQYLCEDIERFIRKRKYVLKDNQINILKNCGHKNIPEIKKFEEIFILIKSVLTLIPIEINDYVTEKNKKRVKRHAHVKTIYNYQSLQNTLKKFVINKSEFFDPNDICNLLNVEATALKNKNLKEIDGFYSEIENVFIDNCLEEKIKATYEISDKINTSSVFCKENIAKICIALDEYVAKEKALDEFINKVLNNQLTNKVDRLSFY